MYRIHLRYRYHISSQPETRCQKYLPMFQHLFWKTAYSFFLSVKLYPREGIRLEVVEGLKYVFPVSWPDYAESQHAREYQTCGGLALLSHPQKYTDHDAINEHFANTIELLFAVNNNKMNLLTTYTICWIVEECTSL